MAQAIIRVLLLVVTVFPTPVIAEEIAAADSPIATSAGTTFTLPAGWSMTTKGSMTLLQLPEADSHLAIIDVQASDADSAAAGGWAAYRPDSKRPLKMTMPQAPRMGWEERRYYEYETSPNERVVVQVSAWRAGDAWTAIILDVTEPTYDKLAGPISLVFQSLRPKGYQRESFAGKKAHPLNAGRIAILKDFVTRGMHQLEVPGVGLSLIDKGKVVFEGGLGVRELDKPGKVDANTLFMAASNTKAMTTLLLAQLVDEKKLRWDDPVIEIYPTFKLGDADVTRQVLVKHLVCACTGLPRQDLDWLFGFRRATPSSTMAALGKMRPTSKFGEVFQYDNQMGAAAGFIGGSLVEPNAELGHAYDDAMLKKIFLPLRMTRTTFDYDRAQKGNYALPHAYDVDGRMSRVNMDINYSAIPIRPAGGVWSSAHDLGRYVQMELARGKLMDGKQLASEKNVLVRYEPQVSIGEDVTYGMGLVVNKRWGVSVIDHGGTMFGYESDIIWLPDYGVGAVMLTNSDTGWELRDAFRRRLVEVLFDGKPEAEEQLRVSAIQKKTQIAKIRERLAIPPDPVESAKLAQHYRNSELGELGVQVRGNQLVFDTGDWRSTVASRKNDDGTLSFITVDPGVDGFEFVVGDSDGKRAMVIRDAQHEYKFVEH